MKLELYYAFLVILKKFSADIDEVIIGESSDFLGQKCEIQRSQLTVSAAMFYNSHVEIRHESSVILAGKTLLSNRTAYVLSVFLG